MLTVSNTNAENDTYASSANFCYLSLVCFPLDCPYFNISSIVVLGPASMSGGVIQSLNLRSDPNAELTSCHEESVNVPSRAPIATHEDDCSSTTSDMHRYSESEETPLLKVASNSQRHSHTDIRPTDARSSDTMHCDERHYEARKPETRHSERHSEIRNPGDCQSEEHFETSNSETGYLRERKFEARNTEAWNSERNFEARNPGNLEARNAEARYPAASNAAVRNSEIYFEARNVATRQSERHFYGGNSETGCPYQRNFSERNYDTRCSEQHIKPLFEARKAQFRRYKSYDDLLVREMYTRPLSDDTVPLAQQMQADNGASQVSASGALPQKELIRRFSSMSNLSQVGIENVIVMHTQGDTEVGRSLGKVVEKVCHKRNLNARVQVWDDICTGGMNAIEVKDEILSTPSVLVFCVTTGFLKGYRETRVETTVTNHMYRTLDDAMSSAYHWVIPVKAKLAFSITEDEISRPFPNIKHLEESDPDFNKKLGNSLKRGGVKEITVKKKSWFSMFTQYI